MVEGSSHAVVKVVGVLVGAEPSVGGPAKGDVYRKHGFSAEHGKMWRDACAPATTRTKGQQTRRKKGLPVLRGVG